MKRLNFLATVVKMVREKISWRSLVVSDTETHPVSLTLDTFLHKFNKVSHILAFLGIWAIISVPFTSMLLLSNAVKLNSVNITLSESFSFQPYESNQPLFHHMSQSVKKGVVYCHQKFQVRTPCHANYVNFSFKPSVLQNMNSGVLK